MVLGGALKKKQKISGRFADILSEMYIMSGLLKQFEWESRSRTVLPLVEWNLRNSLFKIQGLFEEILNNYPDPMIGEVLRKLIFPWGRRYKAPSDKLGHEIVSTACEFNLTSHPTSLRNKIISKSFCSGDPTDALAIMEEARVSNNENLCRTVIGVDDFSKEEMKNKA
jgi:acyl-CoA dehydrogenase